MDADQHCQRRERELGESIRELDAPRDAAIVLGIHGNFPPPELDSISDEPKEPVVPLRLASRLNIQRGTLWCRGRVYTTVSGSRGLSHALPGHTSRAVALMGHGSQLRVCVSGVACSRHSHKPGAFHTMDVPRVYSKPPTYSACPASGARSRHTTAVYVAVGIKPTCCCNAPLVRRLAGESEQ